MLEPHPVNLSPPLSDQVPKESADFPEEDDSAGVSQVDQLLLEAQTYYISHHYAKATVVLKQAISKGSARAALTLGSIYQRGGDSEVPQDIGVALQHYTRALELAMIALDAHGECGPDLLDIARSLTEIFQLGLVTHLKHAAERRAAFAAMYAAEKHLRHKLPIPPVQSPLTDSENHRRAVVIALLFCRGLTAQEVGNLEKASQCYCKVVDMPASTLGDSAGLQKKARLSINQLMKTADWKPSPKIAVLVAASQPSPDSPTPPISPVSPTASRLTPSPPLPGSSPPLQPVQPNAKTTATTTETATATTAGATPATTAKAVNACASCGKEKPQMPMCSRCKVSRYCDMQCQRNNFEQHKQVCAALAEQANKERAARKTKRRATWASGSSRGNINLR